ncbi:energy-coupling factor transport system ATP-binding protein [Entomoplasma freundtii]|uniref:Energy-coupling factor transporter ATP-binding protein EcfA2 n=1 Tax=Entomoplasma freundtii TaxID=74700 RepID=A0A2K8NTT1_9MOLU|nr:energy-coupling factor transporter ATPase [Entomoplasma freundtii]ATZ16588.1 cobalt ABC transporter ATP-binding subunit [Entomoplasma freundtii]TDY58246.1 energy-coupling factor transport system ATP-binding protein [Entomoplasma freundtii]
MTKKINKKKHLQRQWIKEAKEAQRHHKKYDFTGNIVLENVSYTYSPKTPFEFHALDEATLEFLKGKITCVIGTTGSGKSTLIQLTNGLLITETGRTVIGDYQIPAGIKKIYDVKQLRKEIGLVFQFPEYQLFQETVEKDIAFGPIHLGENKTEVLKQVPELLKVVDLPANLLTRSPFELSGGQKRRVAIAGILAMNGNTLVLDEPTGGLDPEGEAEFMQLFLRLNRNQGKRIIMVTHNMDQVLHLADEVVVMNKGKVISKGTPFEIFSDNKLLEKIEIEPPKIYQLLYKLRDQGLDLTNHQIRTIDDFVEAYQSETKDH